MERMTGQRQDTAFIIILALLTFIGKYYSTMITYELF